MYEGTLDTYLRFVGRSQKGPGNTVLIPHYEETVRDLCFRSGAANKTGKIRQIATKIGAFRGSSPRFYTSGQAAMHANSL